MAKPLPALFFEFYPLEFDPMGTGENIAASQLLLMQIPYDLQKAVFGSISFIVS